MKIKVKSPARQVYYPDIEGNADLPEEERFGIELMRPPKTKLYTAAVDIIIDADGTERQVTNTTGYAKAHVKRLINPPTLEIDGTERPMVVDDIFAWDEFMEVQAEILNRINAMAAEEPENSRKNS